MKLLLKIVGGIAAVAILLILILVIYVNTSWDKTFDAPYPEVSVSMDSASIANGKYLAYGPAHCATCHIPFDKVLAMEAGEDVPLMGGFGLELDPGIFWAPNLTPDPETGIGNHSDAEIARAMRHMVNPEGKLLFPFMPFQNLSDEDLADIIAFLRSQEPVKNEVPLTEYKFLGKALVTFGVIKPEGPRETPPNQVIKEASIEYGSYIANSIANCNGCHTERNMKTGEFVGEPLAGGTQFPPDPFSQGYSFITPNLTPHETGIMKTWSEEEFIARFRAGRILPSSPMPWGTFAAMDEIDLKAVYKYLQSLEPVDNKVEKVVFEPGEKLPG